MNRSKTIAITIGAAVAVTLIGCALVGGGSPGIEDSQLGLARTSVFSTPDPIVAAAAGKDAGENQLLGAYADGIPPLISHTTEDDLPILLSDNACLDCHNEPSLIGEEIDADEATPMPSSHYTDLRRDPGTVTAKLIGARYVCTQCHIPQTDAVPLLNNSYRN